MRVVLLLLLAFPQWSFAQQVWLGVDAGGRVYASHVSEGRAEEAHHSLARALGRRGWLFAETVSVDVRGDTARVVFALGTQVFVRGIEVQGDPQGILQREMSSLVDRAYNAEALEERLAVHLEVLRAQGYGNAEVEISDFDVRDGASLYLTLLVAQGPRYVSGTLRVHTGGRTSQHTVERIAGWRDGQAWKFGEEREIRTRLLRSGLFQEVGIPELEFTAEGDVNLSIPLKERSPGAFDLVVGLQPRPDGAAQWVGSGFIQLVNSLGTGERGSFRFERLPGTVSRVEAIAEWPHLPLLPLGVKIRFAGVQQDSLFARQSAGGEVFMAFDGIEWGITLLSERIRPGLAGARQGADGQRVARSDAIFRGVRGRWLFGNRDEVASLQEGVEVSLAQGTRQRARRTAQSEWESTRATQYRTEGKASFTVKLHTRWVFRTGAQVWVLHSERYEASELYRLGGAATFRGFEEDQFLASHAARFYVEPGFQLDSDTRAFLFSEGGRVREPLAVSRTRTTFGYGMGAAVGLGAGGLVVTYALTPAESVMAGKIHLVLSLGF